jgi:A1 cistron-splicing factor AAR2
MDTTDKACALLLDIPPKSLGGIDLTSFTTTIQFKGIRNLPEGWHFIFCSSSDSFSVRHGIWFQVQTSNNSPSLIALKWNRDEEKLSVVTDPTTLLQYRANLGQIWKDNLAPYRQSSGRSGDEDQRETDRRLYVSLDVPKAASARPATPLATIVRPIE